MESMENDSRYDLEKFHGTLDAASERFLACDGTLYYKLLVIHDIK